MRLCFLGSPPFATPVLSKLLASSFAPGLVVTPPDRQVGRRRQLEQNPLAALARERGLSVLQPASVRDEEFLRELREFAPEVILVVAYGEYLNAEFRGLASREILNVHPSLLPRFRGASPIQAAIAAGTRKTGVSLQRVAKEMDAGEVLLALETELFEDETAGELSARLAQLGGEAALSALKQVDCGSAVFTPQDEAQITTCSKLAKSDGIIDWTGAAETIRNQVRAMNPWPLARTRLPGGKDLLVLEARVHETGSEERTAGEVIRADTRLVVATGAGALELTVVKREGKQELAAGDFLRGAQLETGARLGETTEGAGCQPE